MLFFPILNLNFSSFFFCSFLSFFLFFILYTHYSYPKKISAFLYVLIISFQRISIMCIICCILYKQRKTCRFLVSIYDQHPVNIKAKQELVNNFFHLFLLSYILLYISMIFRHHCLILVFLEVSTNRS